MLTIDEGASADYGTFDEAWTEFIGAVRRSRGRASRERGLELSMSQYHLLEALADADGLYVGRLAEAAGVAPPTATRMLDGLERDGVVRRRSCPRDRRAVAVSLTPRGRELVDAKREALAERRRALFQALEPEERAQAARILRRLAQVIDEL
jgi:DNA-binding MarR family transcriptional regulator